MSDKKLMLIFGILALIFISNGAFAWLSGWIYRKPITITENSGNTLTDYQVKLTIDTQTLINDGKMNSDCSDIRFTDANDNKIPYWIESGCNSANTIVWVKVPNIPASSTATIYMYYGNSGATSESNGYNTFEFFFNGKSLDNWNVNNVALKDGYAYTTADGGSITSKTKPILGGKDYLLYSKMYIASNYDINTLMYYDDNNMILVRQSTSNGKTQFKKDVGGSWTTMNNDVPPTVVLNEWYTHEISRIGDTYTLKNWRDSTGDTGSATYSIGDSVFHNDLAIRFSGQKAGDRLGLLYLRKYASSEPTYSTGAEENSNGPPQITISYPENTTYYTTNIIANFTVTDDNSTNFYVKAYLDGNLIYDNSSYANNAEVTLNLSQYITTSKSYNFTIWANDTDSNNPQVSQKSVFFTIKDYSIESVEYGSTAYETSNQTFKETIRVNWDLISNITANFSYNSTDEGPTNQQTNSTHIILSKTITLPLIQDNNTEVSFDFNNNIQYVDGTSKSVSSETKNQNITYAYWIDNITSDNDNYIEGEDASINFYVIDMLGNANLTANITFVYNNSNETVERNSYEQVGYLKIFNATFNTMNVSANEEQRNYSATLIIKYGDQERIMKSPTKQLNVYKIILTNCSSSSLSQTKALTIYVKDEETDDAIKNATVESSFNVWKEGNIKRNYAWKFYLNNTDHQSVCIYPSWATYTIDSMLQYYKDGYFDRTYFINSQISNKTNDVMLYLLPESDASETIIYVTDNNGNKIENAIVKVQRYYVGSNSYKTVAQVKTDYEGKGVTYLRVNEIYYRFIIEENSTIVRETQPTIITCTAGGCPPYSITLSVNGQQLPNYFEYLNKIGYECDINEDTNILKCTVDDTSQLMRKARLIVEKEGALEFENICNNTCESSACTLTCDLGNRTNNIYKYQLLAYVYDDNEPIVLKQNILSYKERLMDWGPLGLLLSFLIITTLGLIGIWNPSVSIVFSFLGIIAGYELGMLPVSISSLIGLAVVVGILIYKLR